MSETSFSELVTVARTPLFTLSSIHPLSELRNVVTGTPTDTSEEYILSSGDKIESADIGRYVPGYQAEAGIGIRVTTLPTGSQVIRWGLYDDEDGFFWELDADGLSVVIRRDSVDTKIVQSDWNVDPLDGTGPSGLGQNRFNLDLARGNIFQLEYTWYGYGQITYQIVDSRPQNGLRQRTIPIHRFAPDGATSIRNPNLPIVVENTGAGDGVVALGGRQFSVIGRYVPQERSFTRTRTVTGVGTTYTPIIAYRRRDTDPAKRTRVLLSGVTALVSADMQIAVVKNPNITFGTAVSDLLDGAAESAVEFSVNPSGYSIGNGQPILNELIKSTGAGGTASGSAAFPGLSVPTARRRPVVLLARTLSGTGNITALLRVEEEW